MPQAAKTFGPKQKPKSAAQRGYGHDHRKRRETCFISANYTCETPGCGRLAAVADHITPHEGDVRLQEDQDNYQALCELCNEAKTRAENSARMRGLGTANVEWKSTAKHLS